MKTSGNTILITGGSTGIGLEFAKQLIALNNTVFVTGRDEKKLQKAKSQQPRLHVVKSDVGQAGEIDSLCKTVIGEFPHLNVLINNAGIMRRINVHDDG